MKIFALIVLASIAAACGSSVRPVAQNSNSPVNAAPAPAGEKPQTAISHGPQEKAPSSSPPTQGQSKWTQSGDAIDTTSLDSAIMAAEKAVGGKQPDAAQSKALAAAFLKRATALTEARQYASALGDYRRTVKYDPSNDEAKEWIEQITSIYKSIGRAAPPEGEEPPPLPFKK